MNKKIPCKMRTMAPIYDFRARRAPSTATAAKSAAGTHFQWTDTQNDIYIGLTDKISGWEPLSEHSKLFLLLFERVVSLR